MKKIFLIAAIIITHITLAAQCKLSIKAADSLAFILSINEARITNLPIVDITLNDLQAGKAQVQLNVPKNPLVNITQELTLKPNAAYYYEVMKVKGKYKLQLVSESVSAEVMPPASFQTTAVVGESLDSLTEDTVQVMIETGGCEKLVSVSEFEQLKSELKNITLDMRKMEVMKSFAEQQCIRVDQLRYLMAQLNTEDSKLKLLQSAIHIFDKSRLSSVEDDFFLEKNKVRAREIIMMN